MLIPSINLSNMYRSVIRQNTNFCRTNNLTADTVSFTGKRDFASLVKLIPAFSFPSPALRNYMSEEVSKSENNKGPLSIHIDYYSKLNACKTLDEAKKLYPELNNVIDAKDLNLENSTGLLSKKINKIAAGEVAGITLDDLSLELVKKYYANYISPSCTKKYFNLTNKLTTELLHKLNICLPSEYKMLLNSENDTDAEYGIKITYDVSYQAQRKQNLQNYKDDLRLQSQQLNMLNKILDDPEYISAQADAFCKAMKKLCKEPEYKAVLQETIRKFNVAREQTGKNKANNSEYTNCLSDSIKNLFMNNAVFASLFQRSMNNMCESPEFNDGLSKLKNGFE